MTTFKQGAARGSVRLMRLCAAMVLALGSS